MKVYIDEEINRIAAAPFWLNHAHRYGDLSDKEYVRLRDTLREYQKGLIGRTSVFHRCPPEITTRIVKFAVPAVRLDDFNRGPYLTPIIYCPQITVIARLSRQFKVIVFSQPSLFRTIHIRRFVNCRAHSTIISARIAKLLPLSGSLPLDLTVEFISTENPNSALPSTVPVSLCSTMTVLKFKPWRSFSVLGYSYVTATVLRDARILPTPLRLTSVSVHFNRATSLDTFLEILTNSGIPLRYLSISSVDAWEIPDLNHGYQLPLTVTSLRVRGSSRTVLFVLQAATQVPSITVVLVSGLDSRSGNWQLTGHAHITHPNLTRQQPIMLPLLTSFRVNDQDHWGHVGPDFFRWVTLPNLTTLILVWGQSTTDLSSTYQVALNQWLDQHPTILTVHFTDFPDIEQLRRPSPNSVFRSTISRVPMHEWMELMHSTRELDSSDQFSDTDSIATLSEASNGIIHQCDCSSKGWPRCFCGEETFSIPPRILPDTLWGESVEDYLG
ncbi:hypothetical protein VNI00_018309 [Paramarasmius palmivorus]|uniref:F-box domain-containing protein n=1 Tax=Paramarasmius palmivorus TaxID=297713 RepID=A0AAW0AZG7_9AGAR